jgi:hypothetical protein
MTSLASVAAGRASLRHFARIVSGSGFPVDMQGQSGLELPFFKVKDLRSADKSGVLATPSDSITRETARGLGATVIPKGALAFAKVGAALLLGRVGALPTAGCIDNNMSALIFKPSFDLSFARYLMLTFDFRRFVLPGPVPSLDIDGLREFQVPVFSLDEQRAIADYLDQETAQIDALVAKQEALLSLLAERKRSILDHVLADIHGNDCRLRWLFRPSDAANMPDEEVLSVYRDHGVIPKSSRSDNFNKTPENVDRYLLVRPNDLVVNKMKAWQGSLGISGYRGIVSGDYEVLRPTTNNLDPAFAHFVLRSPQMILEYRVRSRGIRPSQWRLYWQDLADIAIGVPPLDEQRRAATRIKKETEAIDSLITKAEEHIALAKERRSALITAAVTGQFDVRTARKAG